MRGWGRCLVVWQSGGHLCVTPCELKGGCFF